MALALALLPLVITLVQRFFLSTEAVKNILGSFADKPATSENIEAARKALLDAAKLSSPLDDVEIRQLLEADGINPDSLRIKS